MPSATEGTAFTGGGDRNTAMGWGAISGFAAAAGVFLGGVLSQAPGWRWVLLVNLPVCALIVAADLRLVAGERPRARGADLGVRGAILVTAGMLLLVYALVRAADVGWGSAHTLGEFAAAGLLPAAFAVNGRRRRNPLLPFSLLRIERLAAADATQLIAFAGFVSTFCFLNLYMQNVLSHTPIQAGSAYLPVTAGIVLMAGVSPQLISRIGGRPVIVAGALIAAAGMYYLARLPAHASSPTDLLPGLLAMSIGLGAVFVTATATAAAPAGVPEQQAGLADRRLAPRAARCRPRPARRRPDRPAPAAEPAPDTYGPPVPAVEPAE
jgi:predicted MFS family arabinose efflux permease